MSVRDSIIQYIHRVGMVPPSEWEQQIDDIHRLLPGVPRELVSVLLLNVYQVYNSEINNVAVQIASQYFDDDMTATEINRLIDSEITDDVIDELIEEFRSAIISSDYISDIRYRVRRLVDRWTRYPGIRDRDIAIEPEQLDIDVPYSDFVLEAASVQDLQWQQAQDSQSKQTPQQFEERAGKTRKHRHVTDRDSHVARDGCTFLHDTKDRFLIDTIHEMEKTCRSHITAPSFHERAPLLYIFNNPVFTGHQKVQMRWKQDDEVNIMPLKYFASVISDYLVNSKSLTIILTGGNIASDMGGVTRSVFNKAGEYIQSIMHKHVGGRYYFKPRMPKDSYDIIAGCIVASISKGVTLGVPLSYGILYCIQHGAVPEVFDLKLSTLMALLRMDDPIELKTLITTISTEQGVEHAVPYHSRNDKLLPKKDGVVITIDMDTRYEWLKRIIYDRLFGQRKHITALLESKKWADATALLSEAISKCKLEELSIVLGMALTAEQMNNLNIVASAPAPRSVVIQYIRAYIKANEDKWSLFLKFITGSVDPTQLIKVDHKDHGLPTASTCFNILHLRDYHSYEEFAKEMDISLAGSDDLSLV